MNRLESVNACESPEELLIDARNFAAEADRLEKEREALTEALTPSGETKGEFFGKFSSGSGGWGEPPQTVSWGTVKSIMKAIRERAARTLEEKTK